MNGRLTSVLLAIVAALAAFNIALMGFAWDGINGRIGRVEDRIDMVQREYGHIVSIDEAVKEQRERLNRIESLLLGRRMETIP